MLNEAIDFINQHNNREGIIDTAHPRVHFIYGEKPGELITTLHEPALCVVISGAKRVDVAGHVYEYDRYSSLLVSVDLPLTGQIIQASAQCPYICLRLSLCREVIMDVITDAGLQQQNRGEKATGISLVDNDSGITDAFRRLTESLKNSVDAKLLGAMAEREIIYRILRKPEGEFLCRMVFSRQAEASVVRAIAWLKENYAHGFSMTKLAKHAGLSVSALHLHFKKATLLTPLQYQKQLRLHEARRLILFEQMDAASAAFQVGYDSQSQFSREYRRMYGLPPIKDRMAAVPG
ncbi:AraC family transcriptional regulator [Enterobacteriaceae bacterium H20N1]|uniref:AraC family transcriptional regulator n=1 Tax=Dryocola boscaweniae TaxID=2925397 RepID=A0A9X2WAA4_9ENTR|nr:AraC family transcriptional regulator [Dryocola boscaweniae]MCT4703946.1 AraC family transcriptional regulator [Dryocola boscaweniae]MCT4717124.1 AraC family transcriptional regulator [Dryocola boscaweniae]MCT4721114.1 AraC family transcriptional regulator [Dryocola boscaweniae]